MERQNLALSKEDREFHEWIRKFYDKKPVNVSNRDYEYYRWFSTPIKRRQYKFSTLSLLYHLRGVNFKRCLDIGCGTGTWTKLLIDKYPKSKFICIDISNEMIKQFRKKIKFNKVKTKVISFFEFQAKKKFDFVFSSRAVEYIPNKQLVIKKIYDFMESGGNGMIITSHPHPKIIAIKKLLGKKINKQHTKRIHVKEMNKLLKSQGFVDISFYPILFGDFKLIPTSFLFYNLYKKKWGFFSKMFATGYIVKFKKP